MAVTGGLRLVLFGAPRIELDSRPASVDTRKALALAAYLAVTRQPQTRDALAGLLWPEYDPGRARATLRRTLSALHGALGGRYLAIVRETVALDTTDGVWTDVGAFAERLAACTTHGHAPTEVCAVCLPLLTEAAALAHEDFLAGFGLRDSPEFDDWQYQQRERFRRELAGALERLALGQSARGDFAAALAAAGRRLALDRLDEPAHQLLMRVCAWAGQRTAALRQYRVCVQALEQELGVAPLEVTTRLYEAIKENHIPPLPRLAGVRTARTDGHVPAHPSEPAEAPSGGLTLDADSTVGAQPRIAVPAALGPLVGREREWAWLLEAYEGIEADGRVALLVGEAGIGKTRLAAELLAHVRGLGAATIEARCYEGESHLAYGPLAAALRTAVAERGRGWLEALPAPWAAEVTRLLPELAVRSGSVSDSAQSSGSAGTPGQRPGAQGHFYEGLRLALAAACDAGPAADRSRRSGVLFVDDVQWADGASLALLAYLVRRLQGQRMLLLLACRADAEPSEELESLLALVRRSAGAATIELARLGPDEVRALVEAAQLPAGPPAQVAERLYQETEGLPFFVAEYLAALRSGLLAPDEAEWTPPGGVRELLRSRLGMVSETGWQALTAAAVIGRSFTFEVLREVSGRAEEEIVAALEELIGRGLVRETLASGRAEAAEAPEQAGLVRYEMGELLYDFAHEKLRALVYAETSLARRRLLHRRAAEALARGAVARRDEGALAGQIAQHFLLAGNEAAAAEAFRTAGEYARRVYANAEALEQFQSALALRHPDAAALHEAIGDLRTLAGAYAEALRSYETAAALVADGAMARIEQKLGNVYARRGEWAASESHYEAALAALEAEASTADGAAGPDRIASAQAELLVDWALAAHHGGKTAVAEGLAERALALAESVGDVRALARVHNLLGMLASARGEHAEAQRHLERSLTAAEKLGDPVVRVAALNNLALACGASGERERALALAETALAACVALGDRHREAALHNNLADLLHALGRSDEALVHLRQAVTIYAEIGVEEGDVRPEIWKLSEW